ncbi:Integral membrane protein [Lasiodiplodia theobromae]|uniref:Integral membrane protein n=1 Tax=Lasiodiplodia theobromae TaxID=45133 RepID=UPI0015C403ED|nr:Integral membrane protein [Lasiodiplodia theobromae]KAF4536502.1 Integral membrane protein [Lasiodiplodia theobromae]
MSSHNTSSPPSRAPLILLGNILPQSLATLFVLARITTKSLLSHTWGPDDTTLTLSWLSSLALTVLSCLQTRYGAGQHLATVPLSNVKPSLQLAYATLLLYNLTLCLTKVSVSLFYLRVFADRWNKHLSLAALAFVVVYTVPLEVVSIAQCRPVAGVWDRALVAEGKAKCIDTIPAFYTSAVCNILADVWLIGHAVPRVLGLQMGRRQKGLLLFFLSLGWLTIIAAIIRAVRISTILRSADKTWVSYDSSIWSAVEVDVGLICASAPATWKLVKRVAPRFAEAMTSGRSSSSGRGGGGGASGSNGTDDALNDVGGGGPQ